MNIYIQNLQSFYQNKVEILEKKLSNKEKIQTKDQNETNSTLTEKIRKCWFYNKGYCRYKSNCQFSHPKLSAKLKIAETKNVQEDT